MKRKISERSIPENVTRKMISKTLLIIASDMCQKIFYV
ncbi:hypothetical protein TCARB_1115 [Thermofilum adornatum 1505]|uniref:Uncharacterized protein n=1 Tax=Thermofilum adornatum 1505 TaxID=697581 RepID=A0A3G1A7H4_9CREN|nr:hypothetical protein TCARB_1115 [Thermofilum adornatum 1505]